MFTHTCDSAGGIHTILVSAIRAGLRAEIVLRHRTEARWCSAGGEWVDERRRAVRFASNLDALVYCQAIGVGGVVMAFDHEGTLLYALHVDRIMEAICAATRLVQFWN